MFVYVVLCCVKYVTDAIQFNDIHTQQLWILISHTVAPPFNFRGLYFFLVYDHYEVSCPVRDRGQLWQECTWFRAFRSELADSNASSNECGLWRLFITWSWTRVPSLGTRLGGSSPLTQALCRWFKAHANHMLFIVVGSRCSAVAVVGVIFRVDFLSSEGDRTMKFLLLLAVFVAASFADSLEGQTRPAPRLPTTFFAQVSEQNMIARGWNLRRETQSAVFAMSLQYCTLWTLLLPYRFCANRTNTRACRKLEQTSGNDRSQALSVPCIRKFNSLVKFAKWEPCGLGMFSSTMQSFSSYTCTALSKVFLEKVFLSDYCVHHDCKLYCFVAKVHRLALPIFEVCSHLATCCGGQGPLCTCAVLHLAFLATSVSVCQVWYMHIPRSRIMYEITRPNSNPPECFGLLVIRHGSLIVAAHNRAYMYVLMV